MFNRLRKLCGRYMRALLPRKLYKLIANGAIIVPAYYKDIIADAETNFDLSLEDTDDKAILLMRKYAHIIDKGLHRVDASPGHSKKYYSILKSLIERLEKTEYATDSTLTWARSKIIAYEHLQVEDNFIPLRGEKPTINVSFEQLEKLVMARRSNRSFSLKKISDEDVIKLKNLANWASSSCNKQPIEIYATNNPELSKECLKYCKGGTGFSEFIPSFWVFTATLVSH